MGFIGVRLAHSGTPLCSFGCAAGGVGFIRACPGVHSGSFGSFGRANGVVGSFGRILVVVGFIRIR